MKYHTQPIKDFLVDLKFSYNANLGFNPKIRVVATSHYYVRLFKEVEHYFSSSPQDMGKPFSFHGIDVVLALRNYKTYVEIYGPKSDELYETIFLSI